MTAWGDAPTLTVHRTIGPITIAIDLWRYDAAQWMAEARVTQTHEAPHMGSTTTLYLGWLYCDLSATEVECDRAARRDGWAALCGDVANEAALQWDHRHAGEPGTD